MKSVFNLLLISLVTLEANSRVQERILGGSIATTGQFPWHVLIKRDGIRSCGGSIIAENWVLTAAHCTLRAQKLTLLFGVIHINDTGVVMEVKASSFMRHPYYDPENEHNDIALLKLPRHLAFSNAIQPIELYRGNRTFVGQTCIVAGWGATDRSNSIFPDNLLFTQVTIIAFEDCELSYYTSLSKVICSVGVNFSDKSPCFKDGGDALVAEINGKPVQIGITSHAPEEQCNGVSPTAYVEVSKYPYFLRDTMS